MLFAVRRFPSNPFWMCHMMDSKQRVSIQWGEIVPGPALHIRDELFYRRGKDKMFLVRNTDLSAKISLYRAM